MNNILEQKIQKRILDLLKQRGAYSFKVVSANRAGVHDIIGCYKSWFLSIEVKRPGEEPSKLQIHNQKQVIRAGGISVIASSVKEVKDIIDFMDLLELKKSFK